MLIVKYIILMTSKIMYSTMDMYNFYILVNLKSKSSGNLKGHRIHIYLRYNILVAISMLGVLKS